MRRVDPEVQERLNTILESLPELPEAEAGVIHTAAVLVELGCAWPERLSEQRRRSLESLCRKVHVAGRVLAVYRPGWKRKKAAGSLPAGFWPLLLAVLLAYALAGGESETDRGLALKSLNAALAALDLAREVGVSEGLADLGACCERLLATTLDLEKGQP